MSRTVFTGANVFDGSGADPYPADVVIEGQRIVSVGPAGSADAEAVVDVICFNDDSSSNEGADKAGERTKDYPLARALCSMNAINAIDGMPGNA